MYTTKYRSASLRQQPKLTSEVTLLAYARGVTFELIARLIALCAPLANLIKRLAGLIKNSLIPCEVLPSEHPNVHVFWFYF